MQTYNNSPRPTPRSRQARRIPFLKLCRRIFRDSHSCIRTCLDTKSLRVRKATLNDVRQIFAMEEELYPPDEDVTQLQGQIKTKVSTQYLEDEENGEIVPEDELCRWFTVHRYSAYVLEDTVSGSILGAIGFWPLKSEALDAFIDGTLHDGNLKAEHMAPDIRPGFKCQHPFWYIGGLEAAQCFRGNLLMQGAIAGRLYKDGLSEWLHSDHVTDGTLQLVAIGFTPEGRRLLSSYRFQEVFTRSNGHNTYIRQTSKAEINASLVSPALHFVDDVLNRWPVRWAIVKGLFAVVVPLVNIWKKAWRFFR